MKVPGGSPPIVKRNRPHMNWTSEYQLSKVCAGRLQCQVQRQRAASSPADARGAGNLAPPLEHAWRHAEHGRPVRQSWNKAGQHESPRASSSCLQPPQERLAFQDGFDPLPSDLGPPFPATRKVNAKVPGLPAQVRPQQLVLTEHCLGITVVR